MMVVRLFTVLMYSPDGTINVYISTTTEFRGLRVGVGIESCKVLFQGGLPIYLFRHLRYKMMPQ